ncbi:hypothetical protein IU501_35400 [Nocardia otitidiscaviarum]|uniref:hypothetical protein n=1 Tax=Nocardia otitidiscaviarum TaxID=1823 RepID=UPI001894E7AA|nr:hypothetical protein [Nocardia otitidiscaviarum]MBF6138261.1 hypothetical protein [Nocardia otitidiscaviarum]
MSRSRGQRGRTSMDSAAADRVAKAARRNPDGATARSGFAARAGAAATTEPEVPGWIMWLIEQDVSQELVRFIYQLHYPLANPGMTVDHPLARERALFAEKSARNAERARRQGRRCVISSGFPELEDDEEFYAVLDSHRQWTGHWYSRETPEQWNARRPA